MLEKLAKQTAIYGISTIVVRFLNYLLTPYFTRVFDPGVYGITVDVYALIPFALVILTMGMESGYFRFAAKADEAGGQTAVVRYHMGHHFPGGPAFFRAGNPLPHDGFRVDGSGLRRKPRLRSMGRGDHFPRRLHGDSLCTPAGTGTSADLCRVQGPQRRNYGSFGSGLRSCRILRNIVRRRLGLRGQPDRQPAHPIGNSHHDEPHSAPYRRQVAAAGARLWSAASQARPTNSYTPR